MKALLILFICLSGSWLPAAELTSHHLNPGEQYDYDSVLQLCAEVSRLNPSWHVGQKVVVPSEFFKQAFNDGMHLKLIGFSSYFQSIVMNPMFKLALPHCFSDRPDLPDSFGYYMVSSLINADNDGKVSAGLSLMAMSAGVDAVAEGVFARLGFWASRILKGTVLAAPAVASGVEVHEHNKKLNAEERLHPAISRAKTVQKRGAAVAEAEADDDQKITHFMDQLILESYQQKVDEVTENMRSTKSAEQYKVDKLILVRLGKIHDQILQKMAKDQIARAN